MIKVLSFRVFDHSTSVRFQYHDVVVTAKITSSNLGEKVHLPSGFFIPDKKLHETLCGELLAAYSQELK